MPDRRTWTIHAFPRDDTKHYHYWFASNVHGHRTHNDLSRLIADMKAEDQPFDVYQIMQTRAEPLTVVSGALDLDSASAVLIGRWRF